MKEKYFKDRNSIYFQCYNCSSKFVMKVNLKHYQDIKCSRCFTNFVEEISE